MRRLALVGLVAACGNDPGLLLEIHASSKDVVTIEVFLTDAKAGDGMGLPPGGANAGPKVPGPVYTVLDRVEAKAAGGTATILLQRGARTDVPALLVLGYDANHEPIAEAVIETGLTLPASQTVELKVKLDPATSGFSGSGVHVARWSHDAPTGDPNGACIGVIGGATNAFFSVAGDLDCDAEKPDCDDTSFDDVAGGPAPSNPYCVADTLYPQTMDACTIGDTVACTDGLGTCAPRRGLPGGPQLPLCVPATLCKHCQNSNSVSGSSGIDASCEADARTDPDTIRVECQLLARPGATSGTVSPCTGAGTPLDLTGLMAPTWACGVNMGQFFTSYRPAAPSPYLPVGGTPMDPDYRVDVHCSTNVGTAPIAFSFTGGATSTFPDEPGTDTVALVGFALGVTSNAPYAELVLPFRLSYEMTDMCPAVGQPVMTCEIKSPSGNPADDPIWKGCAGAP